MVPNTSSMEFGLVEESSLVRQNSLLVERGRWQSVRMATTKHCLCWEYQYAFGGCSAMVWGCASYDCRFDLIVVRVNLNGQIYRQNILEARIVPHFDNHPLNKRPVFMDDSARPHRARVMTYYLRDKSITTFPWPAMRSPDLNPIEHIWDIIDLWVKERTSPVQTLNDLKKTLHQEC